MMQPLASARYYRHSGRLSLLAVGPFISATLLTVPLAYLYALALHWIPEATLSAFAWLGAAAAVGFMARYTVKKGAVRNMVLANLLALVLAAITLYLTWGLWLWMFLRPEKVGVEFTWQELLGNPQLMFEWMRIINSHGAWSVQGMTPKGPFLWAIWGVEALGIIGGAVFLVSDFVSSNPYCERGREWMLDETRIDGLALPTDAQMLRHSVEHGQWDALLGLDAVPMMPDRPFTRIALRRSPNPALPPHERTHVMRLMQVTRSINSNGAVTEQLQTIIPMMLVNAGEFEQLEALGQRTLEKHQQAQEEPPATSTPPASSPAVG